MSSVLIVSDDLRKTALFDKLLRKFSCDDICFVKSGGQARRLSGSRDFDLIIIDAPLTDESGEALARDLSVKLHCRVILAAPAAHIRFWGLRLEDLGIFTISKPLDEESVWTALSTAAAAVSGAARHVDTRYVSSIEDLRIIAAAKKTLIKQGMSEPEAHKYLERLAMDMRIRKIEAAKMVISNKE